MVGSIGDARRHTEHGIERKQQLLAAAESLFATRGYATTRIADICASAGVAKGLFYWYFPTKQSLFAELVRDVRQQLRRAQAAAMDPAADPLTRIRQGSEATVRFMAAHRAHFALLDGERGDGEVVDIVRAATDVYVADLTRLLEEAQAAGMIGDLDVRFCAIGVLGAVSSFSHAQRRGRLDLGVDELATAVGEWVMQALATRAGRPAPGRA